MELESTPPPQSLLATTRDGRVRYSPEQKEHLLDLFERSGMTGKAFAEAHEVKYPTFALWRKRRRHSSSANQNTSSPQGFVVPELTSSSNQNGLCVELPGGVHLIVHNSSEAALA